MYKENNELFELVKKKEIEKLVKEYGNILCHYTTIHSLQSILEKKEIWFGNTASMNDKSEITCFVKELQEKVNEAVKDKYNAIDAFFKNINNRIRDKYPFALCLSQLEDDAAQWERYADSAKGICIVFKTNALLSLFFGKPFVSTEVFYSFNVELHEHYKILVDYFKTGIINGFEDVDGLIENIIATASSYKHSSFSSEKEVRLVTLSTDTILECTDKYADLEFINKNDCVRSVLKVYLDKLCKNSSSIIDDIISSIVIGPRSLQSEYELRKYINNLKLYSLAEKIRVSKCPLR